MSVRMVLLGPPGAGKGTQAARISERLNIPAISTGDIFRKNIAEGTELGKAAKSYIDKGEYVPNEVTNGLVHDRLHWDDAVEGFLLDGYPRTLDQVEELERMLSADGLSLDVAVEITADTEEIVKRLLKRATEQNRADALLLEVQHETVDIIAEVQQLARHRLVQPIDMGNAVADLKNRADIVDVQINVVVLDSFLNYGSNFFRIHFHISLSPR